MYVQFCLLSAIKVVCCLLLNLAVVFYFPQTVDGMILEKPVDKNDAYRMLSKSVSRHTSSLS